jgi:hypothetical protein
VSVAGQQCTGLDLKQVTTLLQVLKTMRPRPSLFRTNCPW